MESIGDICFFNLAFSVQDVDNTNLYKMALNSVLLELTEQMDLEEVPYIETFEDETGTYLIVETQKFKDAFNFIDLFADLLTDPEFDEEIDLDHLQLFTHHAMLYQRFNNFKVDQLTRLVSANFEDIDNLEKQVTEINSTMIYNAVPTLRPILNVLAHGLESLGVDVQDKINTVAKPTLH